ncbi:hydroxyacylglutathione hydrolase [Myxococcota bacterium]
MEIALVRCFSDNYSYLLWQQGGREAVVVDPGDAGPVLEALSTRGLELRAILATHHHSDHLGGVRSLVEQLGPLRVLAHREDQGRIPELTDTIEHGEEVQLAGLDLRVLHVPGHTRGSVAYLGEHAVFTGDTLFVAGCGRLVGGTVAEMFRSLQNVLAQLPVTTLVYCGHEYTEGNLRFALHVEPDCEPAAQKLERVLRLRNQGQPTVPSTLDEELATNPFMRRRTASELQQLALRLDTEPDPMSLFAALRARKDGW